MKVGFMSSTRKALFAVIKSILLNWNSGPYCAWRIRPTSSFHHISCQFYTHVYAFPRNPV